VSEPQLHVASTSRRRAKQLGLARGQRSFEERELELIFSFVFYLERRNNVIFFIRTQNKKSHQHSEIYRADVMDSDSYLTFLTISAPSPSNL